MEKYLMAEADYLAGMKYKDIAAKYEVSENTVKSWKTRYRWSRKKKLSKSVHTKKKSVHTKLDKKVCTQKEGAAPLQEAQEAEDAVTGKLTEKQRLFCILYVKYRNKTKAYQKAFECSYMNACSHASALWKNVEIKTEINRLLNEYRKNVDLDIQDLFQWYLDIARADITDFVEFGREQVPVMGAFGPVQVKDEETGEKVPLMQEVNAIRFRESNEVDGSLISEVKQGKNGSSVKLADKMKALQWLGEHIGLADEKTRAEIALLRARSQTDEREEQEPDGFIEALNGSAAEDWTDETSEEEATDI